MEFLVDEIEATPDGLVLHGIVNDGCVRVGGSFLAVRRILLSGDRTPPEPMIVHVRQIIAYRHVLDELPRGMGGGLLVDVRKIDVTKGDMLFGPDKADEIS